MPPNTENNIWVAEYALQDANALFSEYDSIKVRSVGEILNSEFEPKYIARYLPKIKAFFEGCEKSDSPYTATAQKELLSFVIMAEYGGYFFDTTTRFVSQPNFKTLTDIKVTLPPHCREKYDRSNVLPWYGIDIWSFASPGPGHPIFMECLESFFFGPEATDSYVVGLGGGISRGLIEKHGMYPAIDLLKSLSWCVNEMEIGWDVPELNMQKIHTGLWRATTMLNPLAYKELGLTMPREQNTSIPVPKKIRMPAQATLLALDVEGTIITGYDFSSQVVGDRSAAVIHPDLSSILEAFFKAGFIIVLATGTEGDNLSYYQSQFKKAGFAKYITAYKPKRHDPSDSKEVKLAKYRDQLNSKAEEIYYYDDAQGNVERAIEDGFVNSFRVSENNPLVDQLTSLANRLQIEISVSNPLGYQGSPQSEFFSGANRRSMSENDPLIDPDASQGNNESNGSCCNICTFQ